MDTKLKEPKIPRTKEELLSEAYTQIKFLKNACAYYDADDLDYAKQIALTLRVLLYESKHSLSVLQQLERQFVFDRPDFIDLSTVGGDLPNKEQTNFVRASLCKYQFIHQPDSPQVLPPMPLSIEKNRRYPTRAFQTWWNRLSVILIEQRYTLTRMKTVTLIADTDGGAHVDPKMLESLALIKRKEARPLKILTTLPNGQNKKYVAQIDQILAATIRTIAVETLFQFENKILPYCQTHCRPRKGAENPE